ncbi:glycosyltransferase family 2 protein [Haloarcula marismortui]|uniref:Glycosyl transferase n=1 Tax=Haloarcula marismortui ATCC 33799 TaxID=662475 RepID=M0JQJ7_9EURY|nr:glycosyltransferase family 2 protein [Haloarcula californiae]EMA10259.1 glycosyl transferase [Haloarcula californiae ATCC 33799]
MKHKPTVSIVITTYYRNGSLGQSIESALNQSYEPIEIVVVDDSGTNHAENIVNDYCVKYVPKRENNGQISAWNTGIRESSGSLIQFLDDDDQLAKSKIEDQVSKFKSDQNIGVVYSGIKWETGDIILPNKQVRGDILKQALTLNTSPCVTSTMLIKRNIIEKIHPIPDYSASTDDVLKIELAQHTRFDFVYDSLVIRGENDDNVPSSDKIKSWWKIIRDYEDTYERYEKDVYLEATSYVYHMEGRQLLKQNIFSAKGRFYLLKAAQLSPQMSKTLLLDVLRSLLGNSVAEALKYIYIRWIGGYNRIKE